MRCQLILKIYINLIRLHTGEQCMVVTGTQVFGGKILNGSSPQNKCFFFSLPNPDITTMSEDAGFGQRGIFMSLFTVYLSDLTYVSFFARLYM